MLERKKEERIAETVCKETGKMEILRKNGCGLDEIERMAEEEGGKIEEKVIGKR